MVVKKFFLKKIISINKKEYGLKILSDLAEETRWAMVLHDLAGPLGAIKDHLEISKNTVKASKKLLELGERRKSGLLNTIDICLEKAQKGEPFLIQAESFLNKLNIFCEEIIKEFPETKESVESIEIIKALEETQEDKRFTLEKLINLVLRSLPLQTYQHVILEKECARNFLIAGHEGMWIRVLTNVLGNALKYTELRMLDKLQLEKAVTEGGKARIKWVVTVDETQSMLISIIQDQGGGLLTEMKDLKVGTQMSETHSHVGHGFGHGVLEEAERSDRFEIKYQNRVWANSSSQGLEVEIKQKVSHMWMLEKEGGSGRDSSGRDSIAGELIQGSSGSSEVRLLDSPATPSSVRALYTGTPKPLNQRVVLVVEDEDASARVLERLLGRVGVNKKNIFRIAHVEDLESAMGKKWPDIVYIDDTGVGAPAVGTIEEIYRRVIENRVAGTTESEQGFYMPAVNIYSGNVTSFGYSVVPKPVTIDSVKASLGI